MLTNFQKNRFWIENWSKEAQTCVTEAKMHQNQVLLKGGQASKVMGEAPDTTMVLMDGLVVKSHRLILASNSFLHQVVLVGLNWSRSRGLFTQNGSDSLKCIAAQHCLSNWRRFFILFPENKTFFQIKLFCTFMVWRDIFWISLLSSVFLVQLSNVSPQPAFCPNYDCSDWKIIELFLASL